MELKASSKTVNHQQTPPPPVAAENLDGDYREPTKAEIQASLEIGLRQALAGEGIPVEEWLANLDQ